MNAREFIATTYDRRDRAWRVVGTATTSGHHPNDPYFWDEFRVDFVKVHVGRSRRQKWVAVDPSKAEKYIGDPETVLRESGTRL